MSNPLDKYAWHIEQKNAFVDFCIKGFGSMTKNDYEVAIFHEMLKAGLSDKTDFQISLLLHIPETKIKRLRYEATLRYLPRDNADQYKNAFIHLLEKGSFRVTDNHRIQFSISDKLFRLYINDLLMRDGRFADTSFNPNIVSLPWKDFEYLLNSFGMNDKNRLDRIKESVKDTDIDLPTTMLECCKEFGIETLKNVGRKVAGKAGDRFIDYVLDKAEEIVKKEITT